MRIPPTPRLCTGLLAAVVVQAATVGAEPTALLPDIEIRQITTLGKDQVRIARDPTTGVLYTLKTDGTIRRIDVEGGTSDILFTRSDHGLPNTQGMCFGPDGTLYLTGFTETGDTQVATILRGVKTAQGSREWSVVAASEPYELSDSWYNHRVNAVIVSPQGRYLFVNFGSRTEHGEVQDKGGAFPGLRETGITAVLLRIPADAQAVTLPNDRQALRAAGFLYAEGLRNSFDLAFAPNGDLFATENGPNRDHPEEINWIRQGHHYGFPWRMGVQDNPQQFAGYDPSTDPLLLPSQINAGNGLYADDPDFPPPPAGIVFTDPVVNLGPDGDRFVDPQSGEMLDASDLGLTVSTLTAHRSPLGLVFDTGGALADGLRGDGFVLSWSSDSGQLLGHMGDTGEDLLHLEFFRQGESYRVRATQIATGFGNPIDAVLVDNRLYVLEYGGSRSLWEVTLPGGTMTAVGEATVATPAAFVLERSYPNPFNPTVTIPFRLPGATAVHLAVYDLAGQRIRTLVQDVLGAGVHAVTWDGRDEEGLEVASGVYLYRLVAGGNAMSRSLVRLR